MQFVLTLLSFITIVFTMIIKSIVFLPLLVLQYVLLLPIVLLLLLAMSDFYGGDLAPFLSEGSGVCSVSTWFPSFACFKLCPYAGLSRDCLRNFRPRIILVLTVIIVIIEIVVNVKIMIVPLILNQARADPSKNCPELSLAKLLLMWPFFCIILLPSGDEPVDVSFRLNVFVCGGRGLLCPCRGRQAAVQD